MQKTPPCLFLQNRLPFAFFNTAHKSRYLKQLNCFFLVHTCVQNQVLAIYLKGQKRTKEAVAVMKRMRAMEEELAGVPQEDAEGEEEAA